MQVDRRVIESSLLSKGFEKQESSHHTYFHHIYVGKYTGATTYTSRGTKYKTYNIGLLGKMKKQLLLGSTKDVYDLCSCPMTGEAYLQYLKDNNKITN